MLPQRRAGTTLLEFVAAPLNPLNLLIASGGFDSDRHEQPYVPGSECVGVVLASDRFATGPLIYAKCHACPTRSGAFPTWVLVDDDDVLPLPEGIGAVPTAAVGHSATAAYLPLTSRAELRSGVEVLLLGATGAAVLLACARRVWVVNVGLHLGLPAKSPALTWLGDALDQGSLQMPIRTEFDELPSAWQQQAQSPHAKYVVLPNPLLTGRSLP